MTVTQARIVFTDLGATVSQDRQVSGELLHLGLYNTSRLLLRETEAHS
jgi:hypothetical protein